ncbi:hypothetical protein EXIGLDRAFT_693227 [Exidia glandulosa HHB12029]|uniref:Uncharacterized protein n=1 Tax=Exidia glandulosa HHB12029 TaxID=1314781 RepID=A0A165HFV0_EXIGL|nr:hypothetical protein EXIGLDRAFT_693227 [Exidia glandulosa HHB12029]
MSSRAASPEHSARSRRSSGASTRARTPYDAWALYAPKPYVFPPPAPKWGPVPRAMGPAPHERPPSPQWQTLEWGPADTPSGWGQRPSWHAQEERSTPWIYDRHPDYSGWDASAEGHAAALLLNAAYDSVGTTGAVVPQVDFRWHRPDATDVNPYGYNMRGDVAPLAVHEKLDALIASRTAFSPLPAVVIPFVHNTVDGIWLAHSRCQERCVKALERQLASRLEFTALEVEELASVILQHPLIDARQLMLSLDTRAQPIYGRTSTSEGQSRLFRRFPHILHPDEARWQDDDGGASGSSREPTPEPFVRTAEQLQAQERRHEERRLRRAVNHGDAVMREIVDVEYAVRDLEERLRQLMVRRASAQAVADVFDQGLKALAPGETPLWPNPQSSVPVASGSLPSL